jgi:hypothetical protein
MKKTIILALTALFVAQPLLVTAQAYDAVPDRDRDMVQTNKPNGAPTVMNMNEGESQAMKQTRIMNADATGYASMLREGVATRAQERREKMEMKREEFKNNGDERRAMLGERIGAEKAERAENKFMGIAHGYDNALDALYSFADRLESRLEKLADEGAETGAAESQLAAVRTDLEKMATSLEDAMTLWGELVGARNPSEEFDAVKATLRDIKAAMQTVRADLIDIVKTLKTL